jgi:putative mycofactocin binding protein MftB
MPGRFDPGRPYRLSPRVALRPEPFGALAYHYGNRRLTFLKTPELVAVVRGLAGAGSARAAIAAAGVPAAGHRAYEGALAALVRAGIVEPADATG